MKEWAHMPEKDPAVRGNNLETAPDTRVASSERTDSRRWKSIAAASGLLLIAAQSPAESPAVRHAGAGSLAEETFGHEIQAEIERFKLYQEIGQARRNNPYRNMREVVVLPEEDSIQAYADLFVAAAEEFGVNPNYLAAFAWLESRGDPNVGVSHAGARGFMQVMPDTASDMIEKTDFGPYDHTNIEDSIRMAAAVISVNQDHYLPNLVDPVHLEDTYKKLEITAVSYNWGIGGAQQYAQAGFDRAVLPQETLDYVVEIEEIFGESPDNDMDTGDRGGHRMQ